MPRREIDEELDSKAHRDRERPALVRSPLTQQPRIRVNMVYFLHQFLQAKLRQCGGTAQGKHSVDGSGKGQIREAILYCT